MTVYDYKLKDIAGNLIILTHIAGQVVTNKQLEAMAEPDKQILEVLRQWQKGVPPESPPFYHHYLEIVRKIPLKLG